MTEVVEADPNVELINALAALVQAMTGLAEYDPLRNDLADLVRACIYPRMELRLPQSA